MNKKGYTLVELIVALSILSVIIVLMMTFIVDLKKKEIDAGIDTKAMITEATLSKTINSDINKYGLFSFTGDELQGEIYNRITLDLENNTKRYIIIENKNHIIYKDEEKIILEKELPANYEIKETIIENEKLHRLIINAENKNNSSLKMNIEAYHYNN